MASELWPEDAAQDSGHSSDATVHTVHSAHSALSAPSSPAAADKENVLPGHPALSMYLPVPFPHKTSKTAPPPVPDPTKVTVQEWMQQQQAYLLDTMQERINERLVALRARNIEERGRLERKLRAQ